jgi:hypothetical protein
VWRIAKRFQNPRSSSTGARSCGWMPEFVSKIAPLSVPRSLEIQDGSSERFEWLAKKITMEEFEAALSLCNNTAPGEDGIRFGMLKKLLFRGEKNSCSTFSTTFFRMALFPGAILTLIDPSACYLELERCSRKLF